MNLKSLKNNILLYLLLFTTLPLLFGSLVIIYNVYQSEKQNIFYKHTQYLTQAKEEIDLMLVGIEKQALYLKENYSEEKNDLIVHLLELSKHINTIMILNNNGIIKDIVSSKNENILKGYDYSNAKYFKKIQSGKDTHWSDVTLSWDRYIPAISYSFRIDNNTIGVMMMNLAALDSFSSRFKSGDGSSILRITDKEGRYISFLERPESVSQRKTIQDTQIYRNYISRNSVNQQIIFEDNFTKLKNIGIYGVTNKLHWGIIIKEKYSFVFSSYYTNFIFISLFTILLITISTYFSFRLSKSILRPLDLLNKKMDDIAKGKKIGIIKESNYRELANLSKNFLLMQKQIKDREHQNRLKDKQIYDSAKMVQMGEMIGNIAHQWRQPLSVISTAASGMKIQKEYDILSDEKFIEYCDLIVDSSQFLSETIETFRNFIRDNKELRNVLLQNEIDNILKIISAALSNNHIELINNINYEPPINMFLSVGELSQVIINIMNNAKDILLEKEIENPFIIIEMYKKGEKVYITIEDNAGGVPKDIITKIFDPYFTTKHKAQGTGLGLHMSYRIVKESLKGELLVNNTKNGAKFSIVFPLKE